MIAIPLPEANLMTFEALTQWTPNHARYELHNGTPIAMQPTGDHEDVTVSD